MQGNKVLSFEDQEDVLRQVSLQMKEMLYPSRESRQTSAHAIMELFSGLRRDEKGAFDFDEIQA